MLVGATEVADVDVKIAEALDASIDAEIADVVAAVGEGKSNDPLVLILEYDWNPRLWALCVCRCSGPMTEPCSAI